MKKQNSAPDAETPRVKSRTLTALGVTRLVLRLPRSGAPVDSCNDGFLVFLIGSLGSVVCA